MEIEIYKNVKQVRASMPRLKAKGLCLILTKPLSSSSHVLIRKSLIHYNNYEYESASSIKKIHPKSFVDLSDVSGPDSRVHFSLAHKCSACGIFLQNEDPNKLGYYPLENNTKVEQNKSTASVKLRTELDKKYVDILDDLPDEDRDLLINENSAYKDKSEIPRELTFIPDLRKQKLKSAKASSHQKVELEPNHTVVKGIKCKRCHDALHQNIYKKDEHKTPPLDHVFSKIPRNANLVHVVTAHDFPLSINKDFLKYISNPSKVYYVITKLDLLFENEKQAEKTAMPYFREMLVKLCQADPNKIYLSSGKLNWTSKILEILPKGDNYFIGEVNSGKSTLIRSLLYRDNERLTKIGNFGPGISSLPSFTRADIRYKLKNNINVIDTPGYTQENEDIFKYLEVDHISDVFARPLRYSPKKFLHGENNISKITFKGKYNGRRVVTFGGFCYLKPPVDTICKFRVQVPGIPHAFHDLEKAKEMCRTRPEAIKPKQVFLLNEHSCDELIHYAIPPFYGNVDIVIGGVGYVTITPTGKKTSISDAKAESELQNNNKNQIFEIWVPKGIKVCIREQIFNYIYKTKGSVDNTGNKLKKANIVKRGVTELKKIPNNKKIISSLYVVPENVEHAVEVFADETYLPETEDSYQQIQLIDPVTENQAAYPNFYWKQELV
ncbi:hypothetical protein PACTADRAFT_17697 [Pachysolen tannophilus NRRL Y-2460]|uniref:Genetic interactor of prohibitins 3, mitochondrial n=1 Tax=Pachysolen tannophilus NRRL Y-2460 TaxID=669874 RepID=A0A1E4TTC1_PACTA|nr:hypothetical protein PACTADRAFT_17697 [Pachysolen tannophilus NRRL Y-2460]